MGERTLEKTTAHLHCLQDLTLKKPGLLTPSHSRGGGFHPPLGSRPRSAEKL